MSAVASVSFAATVPKAGLADDQAEDQFQVSEDLRTFAVSDGATHSLYARLWARCLVERYCEEPGTAITPDWLKPAAFRFFKAMDINALPWHAIAKLNEGTFATLAGLLLSPNGCELDGLVIGDSCIVLWSPGTEPIFFPPYTTEDLQLDPYLLSTLADLNEASLLGSHRIGPLALPPGLTIAALMTDAVARWFLEQTATAGMQAPLDRLLACQSHEDFSDLVDCARINEGMKNDDCTLVVVEFSREPCDAAANAD